MELFRAFGRLALTGQRDVSQGLANVDKAGAKTGRNMADLGKKFGDLGRSIATGLTVPITAAVAGLTNLSKTAVDNAREIRNQARISNTGTETFQRNAAAARTVGIESDKLSDIYKDMADRIGDFMATGGGPMADFFEQVAPKVKLSAKHFKNLSGPDALMLYVAALQKANLNQSQMTFYMEAIASDSTALLPLLLNNGRGMRELGDEAQRLGVVLSTSQLRVLDELGKELSINQMAWKGLTNELAVEFAPTLKEMAISFRETLIPAIRDVARYVIELVDAFRALDPQTQKMIALGAAFVAFGGPAIRIVTALIGPIFSLIGVIGSLATGGGALASVFSLAFLPVILKVTAVAGAFYLAYLALAELWPILGPVFESLGTAAMELGSLLWDGLRGAAAAGSWLLDQIREMGSGIIDVFKSLPSAIGGYITSMVDGVTSKVRGMVNSVLNSMRALYKEAVGNSIIPDLSRDVVSEVAGMADGSIAETKRMNTGMTSAMPRSGFEAPATGAFGSSAWGGISIDMRHSVFRDDRDMLSRMRLAGADMTGAY